MRFRLIGTSALVLGALSAVPATGPLLAQDDAPAEVIYLFAELDGASETAEGDSDGYGDMAAAVKLAEGKFCYELSVGDIGAPTAAHIHEGKAGADGAPVITISVTGAKNETCVEADAKLLKKIAGKPGDYYVNVHDAAHTAGAIRGQLQM